MEIAGILQNLGTYVSNKGSGRDNNVPDHRHYAQQYNHQPTPNHWTAHAEHPNHYVNVHYGGGAGIPIPNNIEKFEDDIPPPAPVKSADDEYSHNEKLRDIKMLPTSSRIEEIINSLRNFKIQNSMPPKIEFTATADDVGLEENVRMLFSGTLSMRLRIVETLKLVLLSENSLMSEAQKQSIRETKEKRLNSEQKQDILKFYPCLIALMKVLLIRCEGKGTQHSTTADATLDHILLVLWRNVMSKLSEIYAVIIYGKNQGFIDLGAYPTDLQEITKDENKEIQHVTDKSRKIHDSICELNKKKNEGDKEIEAIQARYADISSSLKLRESEYAGTQHLLDSLTHIGQIVKRNKREIDEILK
jgi:hypothetical protein